MKKTSFFFLLLLTLISSLRLGYTQQNKNATATEDAFKGVKSLKIVYDFDAITEIKRLNIFLHAIIDARDRAQAAKIKTDMVLTFRGPSIKLLLKPETELSEEQKELNELLSELKTGGAKIEVCGFAVNALKLNTESFLPEVKVVANTINSLAGYQEQGYKLIHIQ